MDPTDRDSKRLLPIEYAFPDDTPTFCALEFGVQHTEHEFILSFFDVRIPLLAGTPSARAETLKEIRSVPARCVARVVVSAGKMPAILKALQDTWNAHEQAHGGVTGTAEDRESRA